MCVLTFFSRLPVLKKQPLRDSPQKRSADSLNLGFNLPLIDRWAILVHTERAIMWWWFPRILFMLSKPTFDYADSVQYHCSTARWRCGWQLDAYEYTNSYPSQPVTSSNVLSVALLYEIQGHQILRFIARIKHSPLRFLYDFRSTHIADGSQ